MKRGFYLSTRKDRSSQNAALLEVLEQHGWERTYVWGDIDSNSDQYGEIAEAELKGIRLADVVLVLLPGGFGTHVELGAALALDKPVLLHAPDYKTLETPYVCVFHYHPMVQLIVSDVIDPEVFLNFMTDIKRENNA
jgi:nucleoside 2-deoxyribosyltransferase